MAIVPGPPASPNRNKAFKKYQEAYKRWVKALHTYNVLHQDEWAWVEITEILPSDRGFAYEWGKTIVVTGKDFKATYEQESKDTGRWCVGRVITDYDMAYFLLCGWARKCGQRVPPKHS